MLYAFLRSGLATSVAGLLRLGFGAFMGPNGTASNGSGAPAGLIWVREPGRDPCRDHDAAQSHQRLRQEIVPGHSQEGMTCKR